MKQAVCDKEDSTLSLARGDCPAVHGTAPPKRLCKERLSGWRRGALQWLVCCVVSVFASVGGSTAVIAKGSPSLGALKTAYANAQAHSHTLAGQIQTLAGREISLSRQIYLTEHRLVRLRLRQVRAQQVQRLATAAAVADRAAVRRDGRLVRVARGQLRGQLVFWYEEGNVPFLQILLQAKNFSDLLYRMVAMNTLIRRQQDLLRRDFSTLRTARRLEIQSIRAQWRATAARRRMEALNRAAGLQQAVERQLMWRVTAQKRVTFSLRAGTIASMQRLASEISAVEQAQARAAAAARLAAQKAQGAATPPSSSGVLQSGQVRQDMIAAVNLTGVAANWVPWLELIANYESSGDPSAVSPIAVDGEHATGLMQMLPDTFRRYALPGYNNIWNPTDNAAAAIRYIEANYGAPWHIPGIGSQATYHGY